MTDLSLTRVFVVDDHELVRTGLRQALDAAPGMEFVGEAETVAEALSGIAVTLPDVAVLDVRLLDGDGVELCREVHARHPGVRSVMLTSFGGDEAVYDAVLAGASGYLLKGMKVADLIEAIARVARGDSLLDPAVTRNLLERLRSGGAAAPADGLTAQEEQVLAAIIEGLSNREIAATLHLAEQTVKNYVSSLMSKLGVRSRTQAAVLGARRRSPGEGRAP